MRLLSDSSLSSLLMGHKVTWFQLRISPIPHFLYYYTSHFLSLIVVVVQLLRHVWLFVTPWMCQNTRLCRRLSSTLSQSLLKFMSIESVMLSNHLILCHSLSFCLQFFPASGSFPMHQLSYQVAKLLDLQLQHQSFQWIFRTDFLQNWLVGSPCCPRDSQESSPTPQFKSINSLALNFLYSPTLTSIHKYWKNHSFD